MARRVYTPEMQAYIAENVQGRPYAKLAEMFSKRFGIATATSQIRAYASNHHLSNGMPTGTIAGKPSKRYPPEIAEFIRENVVGRSKRELANLLNERFGTDYTEEQIKSYTARFKLRNGRDCRIKPGTPPPNKGKKGYCAPGCEKSWFKKGHTPGNKLPIGTVLMKSDGYLWRKLGEGEGARDWRQEHILVWEAANGPIPKGAIVLFKDGDRTNVALENLALITRSELAILNRWDLLKTDAGLTDSAILIAKLKHATAQATKKHKKVRKTK